MTSLYKGSLVQELTDKDFDLSENPPTFKGSQGLLKFYASWCPHCRSKVEAFQELAKRLNKKGNYKVYAVDTQDPMTQKIVKALGIRGFPTFYEADSNGKLSEWIGEFGVAPIMKQARMRLNQSGGSCGRVHKKRVKSRQQNGRGKTQNGGTCWGVCLDGSPCQRGGNFSNNLCWQHGGSSHKKGEKGNDKNHTNDVDIVGDEDFLDFLEDAEKFQISEDDLGYIESGKIWKMENSLEWTLKTKDGFCGLGGYYDDGILHITSFKASPESKGWGTKCIQYIWGILSEMDIDITVEDELDEASEFWGKMRDKNYII